MAYFSELAAQLGISIWLLAVILVWSIVWKALGLWKSARKTHVAWFIVIMLVNTVGILEILYIYVFSDLGKKSKAMKKVKKNKKK